MKTVTKLEPQRPVLQSCKRVAAYARVSLDSEQLMHSLSAQVSYYNKKIQTNPDWLFAGVFADEGISGTGTKKRQGFNRMIQAAEAGRIDIILTKSISRFARNTVDLLNTVRHLREIGVEVRFERENIHSLSGDGELMLSILASFAQEESRSISDNMKWSSRKRMERGIPNCRFHIYGYRWEGDELVPVPEEAAVVKRIFREYLDGRSRPEIASEFAAEGIRTREGALWAQSSIRNILMNITYTGNLLLQKNFSADAITKRQKKNQGELPQYYVAGTHEAIIDRETFDRTQSELARRKAIGRRAFKSLNTCFLTGKIKCGCCGSNFVHGRSVNPAKATKLPAVIETWTCGKRYRGTGHCVGKQITQTVLLREIRKAMGTDEIDEDEFERLIDKIMVTGPRELTFHFRDGHETVQEWSSTHRKEFWTEEEKRQAYLTRREHPVLTIRGASCFTSKIECGCCGKNFNKQTRRDSDGEVSIWVCLSKRKDPGACSMTNIHEAVLKETVCQAMGLEAFDPDAFTEKVDHVTVTGKGTLTVFMKDGSAKDMTFSTRRRPLSEEARRKRGEAIRASFTPERRQQMSERMKLLRKEHKNHW